MCGVSHETRTSQESLKAREGITMKVETNVKAESKESGLKVKTNVKSGYWFCNRCEKLARAN